jgi:hypothetical protein
VKGVLPKGPGVGPDRTLPRGNRSRDRSRAFPLKSSTSASVGDGRGTRHDECRYSGLG